MLSLIRLPIRLSAVLALAFTLSIAAVHAQEKSTASPSMPSDVSGSVLDLINRYPPGTINSDELASSALSDVKKERANVDARYKQAQSDCKRKFLVNKCRDEAKERSRKDRERLKLVENEAAKYQRQAKVIKRDEELAEKRKKEEAESGERVKKRQEYEKKDAKRAENANSSLSKDKNEPGPATGAGAAMGTGKPGLSSKEREENVEAYQRKLRDIELNRQKVAKRKAENEKKREKKKADAAREKEKAAAAAAKQEQAEPASKPAGQ